MAAPLVKGNPLTSLEQIEGSPQTDMTATGKRMTYKYVCLYESVTSLLPAFSYVCPDDSALRLVSVGYVKDGIIARVSVVYGAESVTSASTENPTPDGDPSVEGDSNVLEIPILQHPDYSGSWTDIEGIESYLSPQPTATFTWYAEATSASVLTESVRIKNVGKLVNPAGVKDPSAGKWLKTGRRIRGVGVKPNGQRIWEISESYQYASSGWNTATATIYASGGNDFGSDYLKGAL